MPKSEAMRRAQKAYRAKLDHVHFDLPAGTLDRWKAAAATSGLSVRQMILTAVDGYITSHAGNAPDSAEKAEKAPENAPENG